MATTKKAQEAQAKEAARRASLEDLKSKKPLERTARVQSGDEILEMSFRSIGRKAYSDLVEAHTEEVEVEKTDSKGEVVKDKDGNPVMEKTEQLKMETFLPELVAASSHEPKLDADTVKQFYDEWNSVEFDELAYAAWAANTEAKVDKQGNA